MRVKAVIAYDGSLFLGSQRQKKTKQTVIGCIEEVLHTLHIKTKLDAAGRTDKGVHARGQVLSFKLPSHWKNLQKLHHIVNINLKPKGIELLRLQEVPHDFHARFSAKSRSYLYLIKEDANVFERRFMADYTNFDPVLLQQALRRFEGRHDFSGFCKSGGGVKTTIRTISSARVLRYKGIYICYFKADGFLRSQVRLMMQAALMTASSRMQLQQLRLQLEGGKKFCTKPAQPQGLYLSKIFY